MSKPPIVVALDGSELSEGVLPFAVAVAKAKGASLLLVTAWEGAQQELLTMLPSVAEDLRKQGDQFFRDYLTGVARRVETEGVAVETEVLIGRPADAIQAAMDAHGAGMLALASHGRSGPSRWLYGSVAGELVHEAATDTLIAGPKVLKAGQAPSIRKILVPLDGAKLAEVALEPALELAGKFGASITLAQVVQVTTQAFAFGVPPVYVPEIEEQLMESAKSYIAAAQARCGNVDVEGLVVRGLAAEALLDLVDAQHIDLVVMASHSRAGLVRSFLGSVADRMLQGTAPVLLVRPKAS